MSLTRNPGRIAGLWYLLLTLLGPVRLIYIPGKLFVRGDESATAANIAAHVRLFQIGVLADLAGAVVLIFLTMAFYGLFKDVDSHSAALVVIFGGVMPATLYFVNAVTDLSVLGILRGTNFLSAFDARQRDALIALLLQMHDHQNTAAEVLWGMWLLPLALLVYKSRFLPRFLGVWLALNGCGYLALSVTGVLHPESVNTLFTYLQPALVGEVAFMLWLVIKGAKPKAMPAAAPSPAAD